ncbi:MAG: hypothetical protein L6Q54_00480 [Leptospiraceae bacterium]|nr:hypothetical protein [Leptospiraceae bacterium]MCK6379712.1 hypothetical protein [Leptospiraceae bacterium]
MIIALCFLPVYIFSIPDRDARGNHTQNYLHLQGKIQISLSKIHYNYGDNIFLNFSVTNSGNEILRIFPVEKKFTTFQVVILDENNEKVKRSEEGDFSEEIRTKKTSIVNLAGDEVKEILLNANETYSRKLNLTRNFDLKPGKKYYVQGYFYPNFLEENVFLKSKNTAFFYIENKKDEEFVPKLPTGDLRNEGISPEETIFLFLGAEMKKNWENYFKYIDFSEYILSYDRFSRDFTESDPESKQVVLESFKRHLTETKSGILKYYKVLSVNRINPTVSRVNVYVEREQERIPSRFEYQYTLKKSEEEPTPFWKISNLIVKVRK